MASRCRWPPDTLVPPCATGASRPPAIRSTKSRACAVSRACHSSSSVASGLPYRRFDATVPENRYGCCGTSPIAAASAAGSSSRTSMPSISTAPPVTSNSRGIRLISVVLPLPVPPMIAVISPGRAIRPTPHSTGSLGARVTELGLAQLQVAAERRRARRPARPAARTLGSVSSTSLIRSARHLGPGHHDEHERGHHHGHQDLQQVGQERGQRADLHAAAGHQVPAEPQHGHAGEVQHQQDRGEHQRHQPPDGQRHGEQVGAGAVEPLVLGPLPDERADHPDAGDLLAQHPVDLVDPLLHQPELAAASG